MGQVYPTGIQGIQGVQGVIGDSTGLQGDPVQPAQQEPLG